ncbi:MAG: hypothetical protein ACK5QU_04945 [Bacteroidota bacterium]|jgi:hypothetical protein
MTTTQSNDIRRRKIANAAIAHLFFLTRQADAIKAKEQLHPAARLQPEVLWLNNQRQKKKEKFGGFATGNIYL